MRAAAAHRTSTAITGMTLFLGSWAMMFAGLFFGYVLLRARAPIWPPPDLPRPPELWPALATVTAVLASAALELGNRAIAKRPYVVLSAVLGATFIALQVVGVMEASARGLAIGPSFFASYVYLIAGFHALHVLIGVVALIVLAFSELHPERVGLKVWTRYWHFVGAIWILIYVLLFAS